MARGPDGSKELRAGIIKNLSFQQMTQYTANGTILRNAAGHTDGGGNGLTPCEPGGTDSDGFADTGHHIGNGGP